jgi:hypothetical protein
MEWNEDQQHFIAWLIEIAATEWREDNIWRFEELATRVVDYIGTLFRMHGDETPLDVQHLVEMRDALKEDREPEAAAGMQVIIDRGIEEYRRTGRLN